MSDTRKTKWRETMSAVSQRVDAEKKLVLPDVVNSEDTANLFICMIKKDKKLIKPFDQRFAENFVAAAKHSVAAALSIFDDESLLIYFPSDEIAPIYVQHGKESNSDFYNYVCSSEIRAQAMLEYRVFANHAVSFEWLSQIKKLDSLYPSIEAIKQAQRTIFFDRKKSAGDAKSVAPAEVKNVKKLEEVKEIKEVKEDAELKAAREILGRKPRNLDTAHGYFVCADRFFDKLPNEINAKYLVEAAKIQINTVAGPLFGGHKLLEKLEPLDVMEIARHYAAGDRAFSFLRTEPMQKAYTADPAARALAVATPGIMNRLQGRGFLPKDAAVEPVSALAAETKAARTILSKAPTDSQSSQRYVQVATDYSEEKELVGEIKKEYLLIAAQLSTEALEDILKCEALYDKFTYSEYAELAVKASGICSHHVDKVYLAICAENSLLAAMQVLKSDVLCSLLGNKKILELYVLHAAKPGFKEYACGSDVCARAKLNTLWSVFQARTFSAERKKMESVLKENKLLKDVYLKQLEAVVEDKRASQERKAESKEQAVFKLPAGQLERLQRIKDRNLDPHEGYKILKIGEDVSLEEITKAYNKYRSDNASLAGIPGGMGGGELSFVEDFYQLVMYHNGIAMNIGRGVIDNLHAEFENERIAAMQRLGLTLRLSPCAST